MSLFSVGAFAQTERQDTLSHDVDNPIIGQDANFRYTPIEGDKEVFGDIILKPSLHPLELPDNPFAGNAVNDLVKRELAVPQYSPYIVGWSNGAFSLGSGSLDLPCMMGIESSELQLMQGVGKFSFAVNAEAIKYASFNGLSTSLGVGGAISYQASDKFGITLFGDYYSPVNQGRLPNFTPGMYGYMKTSRIGGYVDYRINDKWGVKLGVQSYRSMLTNNWETQPIAIPYFRISKKDVIGIDVGGILYQLVKWNAGKKWHGGGNPTIAPPIDRIRPR